MTSEERKILECIARGAHDLPGLNSREDDAIVKKCLAERDAAMAILEGLAKRLMRELDEARYWGEQYAKYMTREQAIELIRDCIKLGAIQQGETSCPPSS